MGDVNGDCPEHVVASHQGFVEIVGEGGAIWGGVGATQGGVNCTDVP